MAEDSIGFDASGGITESQFAAIAPDLGSSVPTVASAAAKKVSVGTASMTVDVAPGVSSAFGVRHNITTTTNLAIGAVALAGAIRWDAVACRYNWSNNTVTHVIVPGTAAVNAPKVAPTLNTNVGVLYDQILALVKATNGSTALDASADMRVWGSKHFTVASVDALPPAATTPYGAIAYVTATASAYRLLTSSGGSPAWVTTASPVTELTGSAVVTAATGWTVDGTHVNRAVVGPYWRQIDIEIRRSGAEMNAANTDGNFTDTPVLTVAASCRPDRRTVVFVTYLTPSNRELGGNARLDPDGTLTLLSGEIAQNVAQSTAVGTVSLRASIHFGRRTA